jgi:hypothetical protein
MGMSIEQAEKLLDDLATQEEFLCKRADDASGYTRSGNESIRTSNAKTHEQHAKEYRQILRYLAEYRLMQADYEAILKADMVSMLENLDLQIDTVAAYNLEVAKVQRLIRDKIDKLKEDKE